MFVYAYTRAPYRVRMVGPKSLYINKLHGEVSLVKEDIIENIF